MGETSHVLLHILELEMSFREENLPHNVKRKSPSVNQVKLHQIFPD